MDKFDRGYFTTTVADNFGNGLSNFFPRYLASATTLYENDKSVTANLSPAALGYLQGVVGDDGALYYHALAILHSPAYRTENSGALRQDWPRIPLPDTAPVLVESGTIGEEIACLLNPDAPVFGMTSSALRPELKTLGAITRVGGGSLNPGAGDLTVHAGWGYAGQGGVTMPGKGRVVERDYTAGELEAIALGADEQGLTTEQVHALLGERTLDIYLNNVAYWQNVPIRVWEYTIGGYQVIKKWLSYREDALLGRPLKSDEVRHVTGMVRRIAAILLMGPRLDANYQATRQDCYAWPATPSEHTLIESSA
jgi:hypothetical protein